MSKLKKKLMGDLISEMRSDRSMETMYAIRKRKRKNVGLVNQFRFHDLIPNKWFDWERRVNAPIMIVGQDWGPYIELKKFVDAYEQEKDAPDFDYDLFLFKSFSSRTEKFILSTVEATYKSFVGKNMPFELWNDFFVTMAVLFTRKGKHFRGNDNFDQHKSADHSFPYLSKQIDIVQPKLIIPLGNLAFQAVNRHFDLGLEKETITKVIERLGEPGIIKTKGTTILPNFHPAAHVDPKIQKNIWSKLWNNIRL